ncbi:MAG: MFS transporter [Gemmatimonadetes bacterium]|jgi:MFS family permease|nr:MFS transporter [Gemmatimonadota bacterium]MDE0964592.1 MFS transporter [Candidatus Latescibacterota bacterium]MBT5328001.1 MFS transporter [Gemmatimonadota bacterium]MBT5452026.1 MFS transporter [Gemmatimonadota bacterium]MBT5801296.1 MFS transporter [Gemmatimonadota bacterium]
MSRLPFFYGWLMVPAVMLISICTSPGQTYGVAVFNPYLREALGLSNSELSGAYMAGTVLASLPLTYIGALMDRYGPRRTLMGVVFVFGITCFGVTQVSGLFTLFIAFFFLRLLGQGSMGMLARNALAMWFHKRLGLASGLANVGMAVAVGGMPALGFWLIESYGWRGAYAVLGGAVWLLLFPLLIFVFRDRPEEMGLLPDGGEVAEDDAAGRVVPEDPAFTLRQVLRSPAYWIAVCCMASWSMSGTGVQFHIVSIFAGRGLEPAAVATMFSIYAFIIAGGRVGGGMLADRMPLNLLLALALVCQCAALISLNLVDAAWLPWVFPVCSATGSSLLMSVGETMWVRYYGRRHLGKIRGSVSTIGVAASGVGPFVMGVAFDYFGGFEQVLWGCAGLAAPLAVLALAATPPKLPQGK